MRRAKVYPSVTKQIYHAELTTCLSCGARLRRYASVSHRTVVTLDGVVRVVHCAYRCPDSTCVSAARTYRSTVADGLALPGFTFGLDIVLLVGQLRLAGHQTVDEIHATLQARLTPFGTTVSRREILYLFDAYCTLLRASQSIADDHVWHEQTRSNGGVIISIDGIQPDKGSETIVKGQGVRFSAGNHEGWCWFSRQRGARRGPGRAGWPTRPAPPPSQRRTAVAAVGHTLPAHLAYARQTDSRPHSASQNSPCATARRGAARVRLRYSLAQPPRRG